MFARTIDELAAGLDAVRSAPAGTGTVELIVARPAPGQRVTLDAGELSTAAGLVGDCWLSRGSRHTPDGAAQATKQLNLMGSRAAALIAGDRAFWPLAGDQLFVDLDLSVDRLPAGTRLRVGGAIIEITPDPHLGCGKFTQRFGADATRFVNTPEGRRLRLRGACASVVDAGPVHRGDAVAVLPAGLGGA